ncbi:uncharacterized protein LOC106693484 [Microplitis demolitor]|uniref:uncharacterized protein LOC106693484 n=1 Tax=Microplitis demolitor TaxID=69319 RepID=UPI0006D504A7|nr:uncharacterized protein LOC106693484 [Microplitis demolitor]
MRTARAKLVSKNQEKKGERYLTSLFKLWESETDTMNRINKYDKPAMTMVSHKSRFRKTQADLEIRRKATKQQDVKGKWNQLVERAYPNYSSIYTDGSKTKNEVAAVAICLEKELDVSVAMNKEVTIFSAEIHAIKMAIRMTAREKINSVLICTDSQSTQKGLERPGSPKDSIGMMEIRQSLMEAKDMGINIVMVWTPAHKEIEGNEEAEKLAKQTANEDNPQHRLEGLEAEYYNERFKANLYQEAYEDMIKYPKGKEYFKHIKKFNSKPWFHGLGFTRDQITVLNKLRSGHNQVKVHLHRMQIVEDANCECGKHPQTLEHVIWECELVDKNDRIKLCGPITGLLIFTNSDLPFT